MGPLALLGVLGAAALAGVSTVPVAKDHLEELVTECIVEVLSNALSKPNAPPINPDCKEILKKGGRNYRERSENSQPEVRHWKDTAETAKHLPESMEEEHRQAEDKAKESMKGSNEKKLGQEEDKNKEDETGHHSAAEEEGLLHRGEKIHQEIREEEKSYQSEEESQDSQGHDKEVELAVLKKSPSEGMSAEELPAGSEQQSPWHLQKARQSPYKRVPEGEEGEADEERSERPHQESKEGDFSHQQQYAESEESEEVVEKPPYSPRRYGKHRVGDSSEEKRGHGGEEEESKTEESHHWDKRNQHQKQHEASQQRREEKNGYHGRHVSEVEEKRRAGQGGEEYRERWQQSEESSEEEEEKSLQQREDSNEMWQEERRHREGAQEARRHSLEGWTHLGGESWKELDKYLSGGSKEKQQGGGSSWWASEEDDLEKAFAGERRAEARTQHGTRDSAEQLHYLGNGQEQEELERQHQSNEQMKDEEEDLEEGRYVEREAYRSRIPAESKKRTAAAYGQLYPLLWWRSQHLEKREGTGEQLLEGKEEGRPGLAEQTLLPEYDDSEWWEKQQPPQGALRQGHPQQKSMGSRVPAKRQHKVEQLAQLLSYRKKAAEFPELYTSREDTRRHQASRSDRHLSQRPLTEEEEKKLKHLAAMELELQKIAQKFKDNRRG